MDKPMARLSLLLMVLPLGVIAGCNTEDWDAGPPRTESQTIKLGDAKSARVEIDMSAGELSVGSAQRSCSRLTSHTAALHQDLRWNTT